MENDNENFEFMMQLRTRLELMFNQYMIATDFLEQGEQTLCRQLMYQTLVQLCGEVGTDLTLNEQVDAEEIYRKAVLKESGIKDSEIN